MNGQVDQPAARGVSAQTMALAAAHDPQLRVPDHPRLVEGLVTFELDGALVVEGAPERQVFRGRAATELLPVMLALLDGRRDAGQLAEAAGVSRRSTDAVLALLYTRGLVEEGEHGEVPGTAADTFFSRSVDATRVNRSGAAAAQRLRDASILVVGERAGDLAAELVASGAPRARAGGADDPDDVDLVVSADADASGDGEALAVLASACADAALPLLRTATVEGAVEIGPLFDRNTACAACFSAGRSESSESSEPSGPTSTAGANEVVLRSIHLALATAEVVHLVSRIAPISVLRGVVRTDVVDWSQHHRLVVRRAGCSRCAPLPLPVPAPVADSVAYAFEQSVEFPPAHLLNPKEHQHHYKPSNIGLQRDDRRLPLVARRPLPDVDAGPAPGGRVWGEVAPSCRPLSVDVLAGVLARVGGLRTGGAGNGDGAKLQRWAPTGGNLGSPQLAVLATDVDGLAPGRYAYVGLDHELAVLAVGEPDHPARSLFCAPAAAVIVLSAALDRVAVKYGSSAYRLVHLDAGCALAQLLAVAGGYAVATEVATRWDDTELAAALQIDLDREPITAVVALRPGGGPR